MSEIPLCGHRDRVEGCRPCQRWHNDEPGYRDKIRLIRKNSGAFKVREREARQKKEMLAKALNALAEVK